MKFNPHLPRRGSEIEVPPEVRLAALEDAVLLRKNPLTGHPDVVDRNGNSLSLNRLPEFTRNKLNTALLQDFPKIELGEFIEIADDGIVRLTRDLIEQRLSSADSGDSSVTETKIR